MSDDNGDLRKWNLPRLRKELFALRDRVEQMEAGGPRDELPTTTEPLTIGFAGAAPQSFEEWFPHGMTALLTAEGYRVAGWTTVGSTLKNLGLVWTSVMKIRGASNEEILDWYDGILKKAGELGNLKTERDARILKGRKPTTPQVPAEPFRGDRGAVSTAVEPGAVTKDGYFPEEPEGAK